MTSRDNYLRTIHFEHPDYIPVSFHINDSVFASYDPAAVEELLESAKLYGKSPYGQHLVRVAEDIVKNLK